jgi:cell wall-associated NlpC family hydrolase
MMLTYGEIMGSKQVSLKISLNATPHTIFPFPFFIILTFIVMILLAVSCSTKNFQTSADSNVARQTPRHLEGNEIEKSIIAEYHHWKGTHHKMGGTGSKGIDCSGFVKAIYRDAFNIDLPRTTKEQVKQGKPLTFKELQPGDLVFFKPPTYARHVGIFLSRSEFVHASKDKGVTVSKIDAHYWKKYYWTARRILPDN